MDLLQVKDVQFSYLDRDMHKSICEDESIPTIKDEKGLNSTELYSGESQCNKCYPVTNYCRGHLGKITLKHPHICYMYKSSVNKLLRLICSICGKPARNSPKVSSNKDASSYIRLLASYDNEKCFCTGVNETIKGYEIVTKLEKVYDHFANRPGDSTLRDIFGVDHRDVVLKRYVLVLPARLLKQIRNGSMIYNAYVRLFEANKRYKNVDELMVRIDKLYSECAISFKEKKGVFRHLLIPRRVGASARAVIVSDPFIGLEDIGVPSVIAKSLSSDLQVDNDNLYYCVDAISKGLVTSIIYNKHRYKLAKTNISVSISQNNPQWKSVLAIEAGDLIVKMNGLETIHYRELIDMIKILYEHSPIVLLKSRGESIDVGTNRTILIYAEVVSRTSQNSIIKIPVQPGCMISIPINGQQLLVHRNPVLSAGSLHNHTMVTSDSPADIFRVSLTLEERHAQRVSISTDKNLIVVEGAKGSYEGIDNLIVVNECPSTMFYNPTYRVISEASRCITSDRDINCSLSINPLATTTYQADFDGDEMNIASMYEQTNNIKNISIMADITKGSLGPIHDAKYGLYCIYTNKIGLSHITPNYVHIVVKTLIEEYGLDSVGNKNALLDSGLSVEQSETIIDVLPTLVDHTEEGIMELIKYNTKYTYLGCINMTIMDYMSKLRLSSHRYKMDNNNRYNQFFIEYVRDNNNLDLIHSDYLKEFCTDQRMISKLYADIAMYLYLICDHCGILFDRLDNEGAQTIIDSGCRPKQITYNTIYNRIGFTRYTLPDVINVAYIGSNYATGISEEDYKHLCFSNRMQAVDKAISTAPEGDNMRLMCNYMSDVTIEGDKWITNGGEIFRKIHETTIGDILENQHASGYERYIYTINNSSMSIPYKSPHDIPDKLRKDRRKVIHMGQRKLLMSEIDFLTDYCTSDNIIVYAGAASGAHLYVLTQLFPDAYFHLYDTLRFSNNLFNKVTKSTIKNVTIYNKYLTPQIAREQYHEVRSRVLFISDIRTKSNGNDKPTNDNICEDNEMNFALVSAMQSKHSMIKFRLPYEKGTTRMFQGEMRLQCWQGEESTETRLVCGYPYITTYYNHTEHEEKMYYHNTQRPYPVKDMRLTSQLVKQLGINESEVYYDMYREQHIIYKYIKIRGKEESHIYQLIEATLGSDLDYYRKSKLFT